MISTQKVYTKHGKEGNHILTGHHKISVNYIFTENNLPESIALYGSGSINSILLHENHLCIISDSLFHAGYFDKSHK